MDDPIRIPVAQTWDMKPLMEISSLISRGTAPSYVEASGVFAIGQRCVQHSGFDASAARPHDPLLVRNVLRPQLGDVLLNSTGTGTIGRSCLFDVDDQSFVVDSHVTVIRPRPDCAVGRWIQATISSPASQQYLEKNCYAGSTNQIELITRRLAQMVIPVPSIAEQRMIADIIDTLDAQIARSRRIISKHQALEVALEESLRLHDLPTTPLGQVASIESGLTLGPFRSSLKEQAEYLRVANVQRGRIDLNDVATMGILSTERERYMLRAGDLLVVEGHANPDEIGRCALVDSRAEALLYQNHLFRIRPRALLPEFALLWLNSAPSRAYWRSNSATSSGLYTINSKKLSEMPVPVPPREEQERLVRPLGTCRAALKQEMAEIEKLHLAKKGLMDDLLTGRVRVISSDDLTG